MTLALSALQTATQVSARGLLRYAGSMLGPRPWGQGGTLPTPAQRAPRGPGALGPGRLPHPPWALLAAAAPWAQGSAAGRKGGRAGRACPHSWPRAGGCGPAHLRPEGQAPTVAGACAASKGYCPVPGGIHAETGSVPSLRPTSVRISSEPPLGPLQAR